VVTGTVVTGTVVTGTHIHGNAAFNNLKYPTSEVCNKKYSFLRTVYNCGQFWVLLAVSVNHDSSTVL
jgi:hypothetical protein